jgi:hypothetical protein
MPPERQWGLFWLFVITSVIVTAVYFHRKDGPCTPQHLPSACTQIYGNPTGWNGLTFTDANARLKAEAEAAKRH